MHSICLVLEARFSLAIDSMSRLAKLLNEKIMATKNSDCAIDYVDDHPNSPDSGVVSHHGDDETLSIGVASSASNSPVKYGVYYHPVVNGSRPVANSNGDDESQLSFADSGAVSEDSLSVASSSGHVQPIKFHCKWKGCQWPGSVDDLVDHIVEHLPKRTADDDNESGEFVCKWIDCKVFNKPFKKAHILQDHCVARHCGDNPFKCIVEGCGARFKSTQLRQKHVDDHFRTSTKFSKKSMLLSKVSRSLSSSVSTDSVVSSLSSSTAISSVTSQSLTNATSIFTRFAMNSCGTSELSVSPDIIHCKGTGENCCCTCLCHSCYMCTPDYFTPGRWKEFVEHTVACCNKPPCKKILFKKKRKNTANNDLIEPFDFSLSQIDDYISQKRDYKLANVKSAYIKCGNKQIFNKKLFQTRPGFVEFTSEVVDEFTELNENNKKVHKLKLSWTPANLIPDSVILKADLEKHRTKFVSEYQLQKIENNNNEPYCRKRRRR